MYGEVVSLHFKLLLTRNSTLVTPTLSDAEAIILMVLLRAMVLPSAGEVMEIAGGIMSSGGVGEMGLLEEMGEGDGD